MNDELATAWRDHTPRVLGALVRRFGHFDLAEDAAQEALAAAARRWPHTGVPDDPGAWLIRVASRRMIDQLRADDARRRREERATMRSAALDVDHGRPDGFAGPATRSDRDDTLAVMLLCCHPALSRPSQIALTLRAVGGLGTAQIARALLVPESTMAQRIVRAKARLAAADTGVRLPTSAELPARVVAVAQVLYLIFTEGHTATTGAGLRAPSLSAEAIRLARLLHQLLPEDPEISGLLALMLLTDARRAARTGADGSFVPLAAQDRTAWDRRQITEGISLVEAALPVGPVGPYQLQAAIAAVHDEAGGAADTDWAQIVQLYEMLDMIAPSPIVTLNRAVAVAAVHGPGPALSLVEPLADDPALRRHHRLHAVRAHLLELDGRTDEALAACLVAARLATSIPEQRHLHDEAARLGRLATSRSSVAPR